MRREETRKSSIKMRKEVGKAKEKAVQGEAAVAQNPVNTSTLRGPVSTLGRCHRLRVVWLASCDFESLCREASVVFLSCRFLPARVFDQHGVRQTAEG